MTLLLTIKTIDIKWILFSTLGLSSGGENCTLLIWSLQSGRLLQTISGLPGIINGFSSPSELGRFYTHLSIKDECNFVVPLMFADIYFLSNQASGVKAIWKNLQVILGKCGLDHLQVPCTCMVHHRVMHDVHMRDASSDSL